MGNIHIVATLETSIFIEIYNLNNTLYDYRVLVSQPRMVDYVFEHRSSSSATVALYYTLNRYQPETIYIAYLYRTSKGGNVWGSPIHSAIGVTKSIVEPSPNNSLPTYLPNIQNQFVYENGTYRGEANSCVANALSLVMDILAYKNRSGNPSNNYFSPSYIYGNRSRQTDLSSENSGMYPNKTIEQINIDGVPIWSNIPGNDNNYKTFPDNRFLTTGYNGGYGTSGQGAKPMFDNKSDTLDKQSKVNKMSFPVQYTFNFVGTRADGDAYSFSVSDDYCPFYDAQQIASWIGSYGYALVNFHIANNFYNMPSSGIAAEPDSFSGFAHSSVILGWDTISSKKYWIVQNSWGSTWGDDGLFYLPMDWGAKSNMVSSADWSWNWAYSVNVANYIQPALPSTPSAPIGNNIFNSQPRINGGVALTWTAANANDTFNLRYRIGSGSYTTLTGLNRSIRTVTGLQYGTTYGWSVAGVNYRGTSNYSSENNLTTAPQIPTITTSSVDVPNSRVSITIGSVSGNYSFFRIWYRNVTDGGSWLYLQVTSTGSHWVTGLTQGKEYEFKVSSFYTVSSVDLESRDSIGNVGYSSSVFYTINTRPNDWTWSYNIAAGQNVASVINKDIFIMASTEWNNFTARINDFRSYKSLANYSFTSIGSGTIVTRTIINQALDAIRAMNSHFTGGNTLISNRVAGQNILEANIYINMRNCLNSIL
jgi:hypothetical protein